MDTSAALEIRVHLEDGQVTRFIQNDPVVARKILDAIRPNHLFAAPQILVGSDHVLTAFQPHLVLRLDLITELDPSWSSSSVAHDTREISANEFDARCHPHRDVQRLPSHERVVFGVWEMANGERVFLQTHVPGLEEKKPPVEAGLLIHQLMTSGGLLVRGREVGHIVLNPARMRRFTSYVGLLEMPANALPMTLPTD